jgi:hypothetical protein
MVATILSVHLHLLLVEFLVQQPSPSIRIRTCSLFGLGRRAAFPSFTRGPF